MYKLQLVDYPHNRWTSHALPIVMQLSDPLKCNIIRLHYKKGKHYIWENIAVPKEIWVILKAFIVY